MRTLHFCRHFSQLSETFIYGIVTELEHQVGDQHVATLDRQNVVSRPFPRVHVVDPPGRWHPKRIWHRTRAGLGPNPASTSLWPLYRERLRRVIDEVEPQLIHAHFGPEAVVIAPVANQFGIPLVTSFYGYDASRLLRDEMWRDEYQDLWRRSAAIVGISNHICDQVRGIGAPGEKIHMVHLGVDVQAIPYSNPADRYTEGPVRCLHVGRLVEKKSPLHLAEAFRKAVDRAPEGCVLELTIAGDGPLQEPLRDYVRDSGLTDHVRMLGAVDHATVLELLARSHIYTQHCVTARDGDQEGQGVSFVEAAASGLPVVATRHNGIVDVVRHGRTGFLVDERDTNGMADRIVELATTPHTWRDMGREGRIHVEESFDLTRQVGKLRTVYEQVHATASPNP
jgi:colanic acid/amylovoran biosynthesis glycosyltransferase